MTMPSPATTYYRGADKTPLFAALRILSAAGVVMLVFAMFGCMASSSVSESSNSLSTSVKASSGSFTSSSEESKAAYLGDIRHYTAAYTRSNSDIAGLTRGLSAVSEKHGITNWEADSATYVGIGEGLAKAHVPQFQMDAYMAFLAKGDQLKIAALQKGLSQGR